MTPKLILYPYHKKLFDKLSQENKAIMLDALLQYINLQEVKPFENSAMDMLFSILTADIKTEDRRKYTSAQNGKNHVKKLIKKIASDTDLASDSPTSLIDNKNIIKEVIINKEENIQEDNINPIQDNNINSLNKDGRNINISPIEKRGSENPETGKKPSKESSPFDPDPAMNEVIELWMAYKKERKQSYKPLGQKGFINKLKHLSDDNAETARKIVEQSIANNWAGIFPLKDYSQPCNTARKSMEVGVIMQKEDMDYSSNFTDGW